MGLSPRDSLDRFAPSRRLPAHRVAVVGFIALVEQYHRMNPLSALESDDWILYQWEQSERIGRIAEPGDPLTILHPGGDEDLSEEIAADRVTAEWLPEGHYPEAGRGERGERIEAPED